MSIRTVKTIEGKEITITKNLWFVTATDKIFTGWGEAEGKIAKFVIICDSLKQARRIADAFRNAKNDWRNVDICVNLPKPNEQCVYSYGTYEEFNNQTWMKYTNIQE